MTLFEFKLRRTYEDGTVRESDYQIPAKNEQAALVELGRSFPNREKNDFEIEILSFGRASLLAEGLARMDLVKKIMEHRFSEEDWDSLTGKCEAFYEVKTLFTSETEAEFVINNVLDANKAIANEK
jgi:hypothetical protein